MKASPIFVSFYRRRPQVSGASSVIIHALLAEKERESRRALSAEVLEAESFN
jgi:hypothetical protein